MMHARAAHNADVTVHQPTRNAGLYSGDLVNKTRLQKTATSVANSAWCDMRTKCGYVCVRPEKESLRVCCLNTISIKNKL